MSDIRRRHPAPRVPAPIAARRRCRARHCGLSHRPAAGPRVGRPARGDRVGRVRDRAPPNEPLAGRGAIRLEELAAPRGMGRLYHRDHGLAGILEETCAGPGSARGSVRTSQAEGAARLASAGIGPALVPDNIVLPRDRGVGAATQAEAHPRCCRLRARSEVVTDRCGVHRGSSARAAAPPADAITIRLAARRHNGPFASPAPDPSYSSQRSRRAVAALAQSAAAKRASPATSRHGASGDRKLHAVDRRVRRRHSGALRRNRNNLVLRPPGALLQARRAAACRRRSSSTVPLAYTNANVAAALKDSSVKPWTKLDTRRVPASDAKSHPDELAHVRVLAYLADGVAEQSASASKRCRGSAGRTSADSSIRRGSSQRRRPRTASHCARPCGTTTPTPFLADFWLDDAGRVRQVRVELPHRGRRADLHRRRLLQFRHEDRPHGAGREQDPGHHAVTVP